MFTFASDSQPQVLLSQEYVLHLLPWARSLNSGDGSGPLGRGRLATPSHHQEQLQTGSSLCLCTRGRSPSGRVAGTVSVCRSASTRLVRSERPLRPFGEHPRHVVVLRPAPLGLGVGRRAAPALSSSVPSKKALLLLPAEGCSFGIGLAPLFGSVHPILSPVTCYAIKLLEFPDYGALRLCYCSQYCYGECPCISPHL